MASPESVAARRHRMTRYNAEVAFDRWLERYRDRLEYGELVKIVMNRFHEGKIRPRQNIMGYQPVHQFRLKKWERGQEQAT